MPTPAYKRDMKKQRRLQDCLEQENKTFKYLDNRPGLVGYEEKKQIHENSGRKHERKHKINSSKHFVNKRKKTRKLIYGHNFSLNFPLQPSCLIPFCKGMKEIRLRNNSQFTLNTKNAFIKLTSRNLIIRPKFDTLPASPGNSIELRDKMRARCIVIAKQLCGNYAGLHIFSPTYEPSTQEYAVKDAFAKKLPFTFKNKLGKFDKSVRIDGDGHKVTGGEIEYFRPEHADLYLEMPLRFAKMTDAFTENLAGYRDQIKFHLATLQDMRDTLGAIGRAGAPRQQRMPTSLKRSATVRGVC